MNPTESIYSFLVAVLAGFLIGLEREQKREYSGSIFAGIRTFPLIALFGAICGQLASMTTLWLLPFALTSLASLLLLAYWRASAGQKVGGTTEVTAFVTFGLGILAGLSAWIAALAAAVITTAILSLRVELRILTGALSRADLFATVQFAAVSLVILPLVPNENIGPWDVWNPRTIWLLVVLISGISFIGYVLSKVISTERSIGLSGLIGGIASSTAVTLSFAERSKQQPAISLTFSSGVLAATAIAMLRLVILIAVVEAELALAAGPGLLLFSLICTLGSWLVHRLSKRAVVAGAALKNPFEIKTALLFALLFALVLLVTKAAQNFLGEQGIMFASLLSGISQLDAIALTLAKESSQGLMLQTAVKGLALALFANCLFKAILSYSLGSAKFARITSTVLLIAALLNMIVVWWIPLNP